MRNKASFHYSKKKKNTHEGVTAKKQLGQHFLKDETVAKAIADTLTLEQYTEVLEIGPGTGVLTKYLLEKDINLSVIDIDKESIEFLNTAFKLRHHKFTGIEGKFRVISEDFLKFNIDKLYPNQTFAITGNFPYNISSQIVFKLLELPNAIELTGMFQKEVAQRICNQPKSKDYGIISVLVQAYFDTEYLFTVPPQVFTPPPKVDSGVIRLRRKKNQELGCDPKLFKQIVKTSFGQRRKTLRNSLSSLNIKKDFIEKNQEIFSKRPEQLDVCKFIELTNLITTSI